MITCEICHCINLGFYQIIQIHGKLHACQNVQNSGGVYSENVYVEAKLHGPAHVGRNTRMHTVQKKTQSALKKNIRCHEKKT